PFSVVGGIALTLLCFLHGLNYISLKTLGDIRVRATNYAKKLYFVLFAGLIVFAILLYTSTDFFKMHFVATTSLLALMVILSLLATYGVYKGKELLAFITSGFTLISLVALLFVGLFPRVMVSSISSANDILIVNASSTPYTLKVMTWMSLTVLPFVLAYQGWTYHVFKQRIKKDDVVKY
ncbi:MAG: cytochrome d ubiquinol oxidase subunit II, partial [Carnobacterium sp.]